MADLRIAQYPHRAALALSVALMLGGPVHGQGPYPPVPGPFPVMPGAGFAVPPSTPPAPTAGTSPDTLARPLFQPPANAMRMPYWMQQPATNTATAPVEAAPAERPGPARTGQTPATRLSAPQSGWAGGYAPPVPAWTVPTYGAQGYAGPVAGPGAGPVSGQGSVQGSGHTYTVEVPLQAQPVMPGYGTAQTSGGTPPAQTAPVAPWGAAPGWGYVPVPGWGPAPYAVGPGWGWVAPVTGGAQ